LEEEGSVFVDKVVNYFDSTDMMKKEELVMVEE
jgi:hypothetical protein